MTEDTFLTLKSTTEGLYKEKGSRFISFGYPVSSEEEALKIIKQIQDKFHDARHHCWAYRLGPKGEIYRINDDGEPSGTAGRPIYGSILSSGLTNVLFIVVRYFGGIKLGTSGLIDAYKTATRDALDYAAKNSLITEKHVTIEFSFTFSYEQIGQVMKILKKSGATIIESDMNNTCKIKASIRARDYDPIFDSLSKTEGVVFL